jgi:hypothetical protein
MLSVEILAKQSLNKEKIGYVQEKNSITIWQDFQIYSNKSWPYLQRKI